MRMTQSAGVGDQKGLQFYSNNHLGDLSIKKDNIETGCEVVGLTQLARDRVQWRVLIYTVE